MQRNTVSNETPKNNNRILYNMFGATNALNTSALIYAVNFYNSFHSEKPLSVEETIVNSAHFLAPTSIILNAVQAGFSAHYTTLLDGDRINFLLPATIPFLEAASAISLLIAYAMSFNDLIDTPYILLNGLVIAACSKTISHIMNTISSCVGTDPLNKKAWRLASEVALSVISMALVISIADLLTNPVTPNNNGILGIAAAGASFFICVIQAILHGYEVKKSRPTVEELPDDSTTITEARDDVESQTTVEGAAAPSNLRRNSVFPTSVTISRPSEASPLLPPQPHSPSTNGK